MIRLETRRVMESSQLAVSATRVRIPFFVFLEGGFLLWSGLVGTWVKAWRDAGDCSCNCAAQRQVEF
jgi:hypothetical protein